METRRAQNLQKCAAIENNRVPINHLPKVAGSSKVLTPKAAAKRRVKCKALSSASSKNLAIDSFLRDLAKYFLICSAGNNFCPQRAIRYSYWSSSPLRGQPFNKTSYCLPC